MGDEKCYICKKEIEKGEKTDITTKDEILFLCSSCKRTKEYWDNIYKSKVNKFNTCRIYYEK